MKKKIVALLMAAAMVSVVFSGCGGGDKGGSDQAATEESGGDDAAASDLPTELTTDLEGEYDPNPDYYKYTLTEYTIEAAGATFVATVSANEDDTKFEIHCNFYGDEQLVEIEKDGDEYNIISDKTGFMETDSPLIIDQALGEEWALIQ